ncbi:MAG: Gfo/Idh/MocA family protein [Verrucomicrobiia bacterium]
MAKSSNGINRRQFLNRAASIAITPMIVRASVLGLNGAVAPSERIVFGAIGVGNRARFILPNFLSFKEIQFLALSDCRSDRLKSGKEMIDNFYANTDCKTYPDFRDLLARKDIDAVLIATGNRWHALASIYAARAGKDIYCEKPVTLYIKEGRALVDTCKRYGTIYQAGTQRRSTASYKFAVEMVKQGKIGKLHTVEMQVWTGPAIPHQQSTPVPEGWNYDMWLGQTPWKPFVPARVNNWPYFFDTGDGIMTDMGCHYTDQMQWALGTDDTGPVEFECSGEFPDPKKYFSDTMITGVGKCRYANGVTGIIYQRRGFTDRYIKYIGDEGWIQVDDETDEIKAYPKSILSLKSATGVSWANASDHIKNLLDCIKSRKQTLCHPEVAHRANTICLALTISARLGRKLKWDPVKEQFDDEDANRMLYREPRAPWRV